MQERNGDDASLDGALFREAGALFDAAEDNSVDRDTRGDRTTPQRWFVAEALGAELW